MQMVVNADIDNGLAMCKYSLNHYWKFKYAYLAFVTCIMQIISGVFVAFVNYAVILQSKSVLDLAKDFAALSIIANFDNIFANESQT